MTMSVPVALGDRSYQIHIGSGVLAQTGDILRPLLGSGVQRIPVVTDETVAKLHYPALEASLRAAGLTPSLIALPPGEQTKSFSHLERLSESLLAHNVERGGMIVALGGGVIGDLTGFAAGILKRGVAFAQIPTTLLAQVDSSVGGKTAINTAQGKNLIGVFHQPHVVVADVAVLKTLPERELQGGYAEIVKYGLLGDSDFFTWLEENGARALSGDERAMTHAVSHSCAMKAAIVGRDEREMGERALLNLGHTFGHGLEAATGFSDALIHGEGVAIGCVLAFKLSAALGLCPPEDAVRVETHFTKAGLRTRISQITKGDLSPEALLAHMRHDKKASGGKMTFILVRGIGKAFITSDVPEDKVRQVLENG
jgi:3-dehydroquinate synthase